MTFRMHQHPAQTAQTAKSFSRTHCGPVVSSHWSGVDLGNDLPHNGFCQGASQEVSGTFFAAKVTRSGKTFCAKKVPDTLSRWPEGTSQ